MAFRLYIVPVVGDGTSIQNARRPKYFSSAADGTGTVGIVSASISAVDYGFEPWMVVGADLSVSDDNLVVGEADAFALPFDLSVNLTSGQVTNVQNKLEAINLPAGWVNTSLKWVNVVRTVLGIFSFMQRLTALLSQQAGSPVRLFGGSVTLATTISQLPANVVTALQTTAASFNLSTAGITGSTTLRVALKAIADQFSTTQYVIGGVSI